LVADARRAGPPRGRRARARLARLPGAGRRARRRRRLEGAAAVRGDAGERGGALAGGAEGAGGAGAGPPRSVAHPNSSDSAWIDGRRGACELSIVGRACFFALLALAVAGCSGDDRAAPPDLAAPADLAAAFAPAPHAPFPQMRSHAGGVLSAPALVTVTFAGYA